MEKREDRACVHVSDDVWYDNNWQCHDASDATMTGPESGVLTSNWAK